MKAIKVITAGIILAMAGPSIAQVQSCPDLSGSWKGSCDATGFGGPEANSLQSLGQVANGSDKVLEIKQGIAGELKCDQITIDGRNFAIGGMNSKTTSSPDPYVSVAVLEAAKWDNEKFTITSSGLLKMMDTDGTFTGTEIWTLNSQDQLVITGKGKVNDSIEYTHDCVYTRM